MGSAGRCGSGARGAEPAGGITPTSRWRESAGDLEDEDVLFGGDPADPGPEAGDDDDSNLAEPWTVAQAQEARADAGCTDLEAVLAAAARSGQEAVAAAEAGSERP